MENQNTLQSPEIRKANGAVVTREALYALVWVEPMLKVAARFGVSSSYMARVCRLMNVPRPERGYWAKIAVGKQTSKPELPDARPGDESLWSRGSLPHSSTRPLPRPPTQRPRRNPKPEASEDGLHELIRGAKAHFAAGRTSFYSSYLKPAKRLLVDLVVTKTGLDKALTFANQLFLELEAHDCHVVFAPNGSHSRRAPVDECEIPRKQRGDYGDRKWHPHRATVVYIGTVAIGLTVIELSEEAEARYVNGEYVRAIPRPETKRRRYPMDDTWTAKRDFPTGRLCLQAYCSDYRGEWIKQWRETNERELSSGISEIRRELVRAAPLIAGLIEEGEKRAELERQEWAEERRKWQQKLSEEQAAKARSDSRHELLQILSAWAEANRVEEFFADAEARLERLDSDARVHMRDRLERARKLIGGVDALEQFHRWKAPEELVPADGLAVALVTPPA